jgi:hypothetical protein
MTMKTISKTRKFLTVAFTVAALTAGFLATTHTAEASGRCYYNTYWMKWMCTN